MPTRITRKEMFKEMLRTVEKRSTCLRSKVAAIIEKDGRVISLGYNGPASGFPQCLPQTEFHRSCECMGPSCTRSIHAETNAIAFAAKAGICIEGATMYCSMSPCINCAKLIINSGIKKLIYVEEYRNREGLELLSKAGIETELSPIKSRPDEVLMEVAAIDAKEDQFEQA